MIVAFPGHLPKSAVILWQLQRSTMNFPNFFTGIQELELLPTLLLWGCKDCHVEVAEREAGQNGKGCGKLCLSPC